MPASTRSKSFAACLARAFIRCNAPRSCRATSSWARPIWPITSATLRSENQKLADKNLQLSIKAGDAAQLSIENSHLRALLQLQARATTQTTPAEAAIRHARSVHAKGRDRQGRAAGHPGWRAGRQRRRRHRSGHARVSAAIRSHAADRQGSGRAGSDRAYRFAQRDLRHAEGRHARSALRADQRRRPGRRRTRDERTRRHLSAGLAGGESRARRQTGRYGVRARRLPAGRAGAWRAPVARAALQRERAAQSGRSRSCCGRERSEGKQGQEGQGRPEGRGAGRRKRRIGAAAPATSPRLQPRPAAAKPATPAVRDAGRARQARVRGDPAQEQEGASSRGPRPESQQ